MADDKRDAQRTTVLGELLGEIMVFEPMLIKDVSRRGVSIETRFPLQLDSLHDLRLTLGGRSIIVKGRVVHSSISDVDQDIVTYRSGVEFVEASERVLKVVSDYLESVKATRTSTSP
jgi:hypothetical protein